MMAAVHLEKLNPQAILSGQTVEGNLANEMAVARYTFEGTKGDQVRISISSSSGSPYLQVRPLNTASSGAVWAEGSRQVTVTLSTSETYCILAGDAGLANVIGKYSMKLEKVTQP